MLGALGACSFAPALAGSIHVVQLGTARCLFATFPCSKFAHMVYRTMAMVHERMAIPASPPEKDWAGPGAIAD